jgi:uncharacterized protein (TIGR03437 family)
LKLNPTGGSVVYNTVLQWPFTSSGFVLDPSGSVYFGGTVLSGRLPVTPGAYQQSPSAGSPSRLGFLAKLNPNGSVLLGATYVGSADAVTPISLRPNGDLLFATAVTIGELDASLARLVYANTAALPATTDSRLRYIGSDSSANLYFIAAALDINANPVDGGLALRKYSPDALQLLRSRPLDVSRFLGAVVAASGTVLLFGFANPDFPVHNATQPCVASISDNPFLEVIGPDGELAYATFIDTAISATAISLLDGRPYVIASDYLTIWQGMIRFDPDYRPEDHISAGCLVHSAATWRASDASPGTIMTLFGDGLGPETGTSWNSGPPFDLAGTHVTVDGKPAPIIYAQSRQINFVMPWSLRTDGVAVPICVSASGQMSCLSTRTTAAVPLFFGVGSAIAAINQDGSVNSQQHPSPPGSYVSLYLTGAGALNVPVEDGDIAGLPLNRLVAGVSAAVHASPPGQPCFPGGGCPPSLKAEVLFAGAVPTLIYGFEVIILRIPGNMPSGLDGVLVNFNSSGYTGYAFGNLWFGQ